MSVYFGALAWDTAYLVQVLMSLFMLGQTKWSAISCQVALAPGWDREWRSLNTARRNASGTKGRGVPVLMSQTRAAEDNRSGIVVSCRDKEEDCSAWSSGSVACALAMASKSTDGVPDPCRALTGARERASATELAFPLTCLMSVVNWAIKSRCRVCVGECLSVWEARA